MTVTKTNSLCMNCLRPGHFIKDCRFLHCCKVCGKPHHSLMHSDAKSSSQTNGPDDATHQTTSVSPVTSHAATGLAKDVLLMTCCVLVKSQAVLQSKLVHY